MSTQRFPLNSEKCHRHVYDQTPSLIEPQVFWAASLRQAKAHPRSLDE